MSIYRRCWEIVCEAVALTITWLVIFNLGAASEWIIVWVGNVTHSDLTWMGKAGKTIIFVFDGLIVIVMAYYILRKHVIDLRNGG